MLSGRDCLSIYRNYFSLFQRQEMRLAGNAECCDGATTSQRDQEQCDSGHEIDRIVGLRLLCEHCGLGRRRSLGERLARILRRWFCRCDRQSIFWRR